MRQPGLPPGAPSLGDGLSFDGLNDYVRAEDAPSLRPAGALTLEGWFNFSSTSGVRHLLTKTVGTGVLDSYAVWYQDGALRASVTSTSNVGVGLVYNWAPTLGTWYNVAFTYDSATGSQKLYIDGDLKASNTTTATPGYDGHPVLIGADYQNEVLTQTFAGKIDDVRIWDVARSQADIQGAMSKVLDPSTNPNLVGYWRFEEGSGFTTADATANHNNASLDNFAASRPSWTAPDVDSLLMHGTETITWTGLDLDPTTTTADISAYQEQQAFPLAVDQPVVGSYAWDTTTVPDGQYELRAVFHDASGNVLGRATRQILVNNSAAWHSGTITANQTWTSDRVHVVEGPVTIPAGVTVTIQPGAIIKFAHGMGITIQGGGRLDASQATQASPIIFTSLADDTAGGDTNLDGNKTLPISGDWTGIAIQGNGTFNSNQYTVLRYLVTTHSGTLSTSQAWASTFTHHVTGLVTVPSGVILTIDPGAVVKFDPGAGFDVQAGGELIADGTVAQPIYFTSIHDDSVGGDTNQDGNATSPAAGDWQSIRFESGATGDMDHVYVRYGGNASNSYGAGGEIELFNGPTVSLRDSWISESLKEGILAGGTLNVSNSVVTDNSRGITAYLGGGNVTVTNCTVDSNVFVGLLVHGGTLNVANTMVTNTTQNGVEYDFGTLASLRYSDVWAPSGPNAANYSGMSNQTGQNGNISADPKYKNAAQGDYRLNYLSPAIDAAAGTAAPPTDLMGDPPTTTRVLRRRPASPTRKATTPTWVPMSSSSRPPRTSTWS